MSPPAAARSRLDHLLVQRGLADTRAKAQALIRAGEVYVNGQRLDKPGMPVGDDAALEVRQPPPYVGRGGAKLAGALDRFGVDPRERVCLDVGASTGGFTDCLLQRGAERVYAVDVGRGQLAWRLRQDPRVVSLERTDVRSLGALPPTAVDDEAPLGAPQAALAVVDVSFISLRRVLPSLPPLLSPGGEVIALVKPQFEVGKGRVGRGGVVRDPALHRQVLLDLCTWLQAAGWQVKDAMRSVIVGGDGNVEFLLLLAPPGGDVRPVGERDDGPRTPETPDRLQTSSTDAETLQRQPAPAPAPRGGQGGLGVEDVIARAMAPREGILRGDAP